MAGLDIETALQLLMFVVAMLGLYLSFVVD